MPDKKSNVLNQILYVFRGKKPLRDDIVAMADRVIEEYIYSKNRLIHRKCRKSNGGLLIFSLMMAASAGLAFVFFCLK